MTRRPGLWISRTQAIIVIVVFVCIVVVVGLLAGLLKPPCSHGDNVSPTDGPTSRTSPGSGTTPSWEDGPWTNPFLPNSTYPLHYDMWFYPDFYFDGGTYTGRSSIRINITETTKYLIVHYKLMNITSTSVTDGTSGREVKVAMTFAYDENQYWVTELVHELQPHTVVVLHLEFEGSLLNGIVGYYKSTYVNTLTGKESWLATTKFQPTDARKAFPNFDEPKFKSTYTIILKHWSNFTAIGNMPVQSVDVESDVMWTQTTFQQTPPMSSYLVCFIVCDFEHKSSVLADGKPHRVWARPDLINQTDYALIVGTNVSNYFADLLGQNFHLPKLDHVAVPDYPSGATEHWGLITYREARLLYDENTVSTADKQNVALIIGHELSHNYFGNLVTGYWWDQLWLSEGFATYYEVMAADNVLPSWEMYFGNLVTCEWWDQLWLNEGFARYYQTKGVQEVEPTWQLEEGFAVSTTQYIKSLDATPSSRPVFLPVSHPDEINQAFSGIVYNKGAAVLRMMEDMFGGDTFRKAIQRYLRDNKFQTVTTPDLWKAFQDEVGSSTDVAAVLDPWVYQMGFPVIEISTPSAGKIVATQRRFMSNPSDDVTKPASPYNYKWYVSLSYQTSAQTEGRTWLNTTDATFADPRPDPKSDWIKFNRKQGGYYRVNYPPTMWRHLSDELQTNHEGFDPSDRAGLLDDAFSLARASQVSYQVALNMTRYLAAESHYLPWHSVRAALDDIGSKMYGSQYYDLWRKYIRYTTSPLMDALQVVDQGKHLDKLLRNDIIKLACFHGHTGCIQNITALFKDWIGGQSVASNIRSNVYRFGVQYAGTEEDWETTWRRYQAASGQEKGYLLYALSQTQTPWLIQRYLGNCMDPDKIRTQDFFTAVSYVASNPAGVLLVWSWARANYDTFVQRFGLQDRYFGRMIPGIVSRFNTEYHLQEVENFFAKYPDAGAGAAARNQALDSIRDNMSWRQENEQKIIDWLQNGLSV